jgi:hypothetical protein
MKASRILIGTLVFSLMFLIGCATKLTVEHITLNSGHVATYITGKIAGDGQEANFRDAWLDGKPVVSHYGSGQSLAGQVLQGTVSSAMIAGGMVGGAALLRPTRVNHNDNSSVDNHSGQVSNQEAVSSSSADSVSNSNANSKLNASVSATNSNTNTNHNSNRTKLGNIIGGSGGGGDSPDFNGCESQGKSSSKNPHCN